jgi:hypothetical protein
MLWVLNLADGAHSLLDIAERANLPFGLIRRTAQVLQQQGLLTVCEAHLDELGGAHCAVTTLVAEQSRARAPIGIARAVVAGRDDCLSPAFANGEPLAATQLPFVGSNQRAVLISVSFETVIVRMVGM